MALFAIISQLKVQVYRNKAVCLEELCISFSKLRLSSDHFKELHKLKLPINFDINLANILIA